KKQVFEKVEEEITELKNEVQNGASQEKIESEFGDVLFSLINYGRFLNLNPEDALERTNKKFISRFQYLETESAKDGKNIGEMTLSEMDSYWNKAKLVNHKNSK